MTEKNNDLRKATIADKARKYGLRLLFTTLVIGVLGFFVLPPIVKSVLIGQLAERLHRPVSIESIRINPYTLVLEASGFAIQEKGGGDTVAGFDGLLVDVDGSSLFRGGPVVSELRLLGPAFKIVRLTDGRLNFSDLIDEFLARPKNDDPTPAFAINNIQISGGKLVFDDQARGEKHLIDNITFGLPFVSSMRDATEIFVEPAFSAIVDGAPLAVKGKSKPFAESLESDLTLAVHDVQLSRYIGYVPVRLPVQLRAATLDTDLKLNFSRRDGDHSILTLSGHSALKDLVLSDTDDSPLLSFKRLAVRLGRVDLLGQTFVVDTVALESPEIHARVSRQGTINWLDILERESAGQGDAGSATEKNAITAKAEKTSSPAWSLGEVTVSSGRVNWVDESHGAPFKASVENLDFSVRNLDGAGSTPAEFDGSWRIDAGPWATLDNFAIKGGTLDLAKHTMSIDELSARGLKAAFKRAANGSIVFVQPPALRASRAPNKSTPDVAIPWKVTIAKSRGEDFGLRFEDGAVSPASAQVIEGMSVSVDNLSTEPGKVATVSTRFKLNGKGEVDVGGTVKAAPLETDLKLAVKAVDILPLTPYFKDFLNIDLTRGLVTVNGALQLRQPAGGGTLEVAKLNGGFAGDLTVGDFQSVDKSNATDFLKWKSLHLGHVDVRLRPQSVSIGEVALSDFFARVILSREGKLNLLQVVRDDGKAAAATPAAKSVVVEEGKSVTTVATSGKPPLPLKIGKITLQGGDVKFSDYFVKPNYSANLKKIGGTVSGLSSATDSVANVDLRGRYDNIAPLAISGKLNPLAAKPYLDIEADVKGIEMTSLSPYAGKYAGYAIEKGKLSVFVKYKIENNQLSAENRLFVDQLTFGSPVDSPDATKLPVTLAVALLKNRNGEIDINLPIAGSLSDPEFSVGGLVVKVIVNLLVKAATSPFALLGSVFGGGEQMSNVEFDAGKAVLTPAAQQRLENLGKVLLDRPALKLEIEGRAYPETDTEGLKRDRLNNKVARLRRGADGDAAEGIEVGGKEYPALLERVYRAEKFPKPRNVVGLVKGLPVEEMEKLILANSAVGEEELRDLAERRATAVRDWLVAKQLPVERLFYVPVKVMTTDGGKTTDGKTATDKAAKSAGVVFSLK